MDSALLAELRAQLRTALDTVDRLIAARACTDCGRTAAELQRFEEPDGTVVWLGPTCWRRRVAGQPREPLPIGGAE